MSWVQPLIDRFAADITAHRTRWALLVVFCTGLALGGLRRLDFDDNPRTLYLNNDVQSVRLQALYDQFGAEDQDVLIVIQALDVFDRNILYPARELGLAVARVPEVDRVYSIFSLRRQASDVVPLIPRQGATARQLRQAKAEAIVHPLAAGHFISRDATTMLIVARLKGEPQSVAQLKPPLEKIGHLAREAEAAAPMTVLVTGHPSLRIDILGTLRRDQTVFVASSGAVAVILATMLFRRPAAVLIAVSAPMMGVVWIVGIVSLLGLRINGINTVLPTLTFAIGLTDSIHLMVDLQRRRAAGIDRLAAVAGMIRTLALPSLLTALTTSIGLGSLGLANEPDIKHFGQACAAGILLNFLAVITIFPLLASTRLGDWLVPAKSHVQHAAISWNFSPLVWFVERRRWWIVGVSLTCAVVLATISSGLRSEINATEPISPTSQSAIALKELDEAFGGGMYGYVVVDWPQSYRLNTPGLLETVDEVHEAVEAQREFTGAFSVCNLLRATSESDGPLAKHVRELRRVPAPELRRLVRSDLRRLVVSFHMPDIGGSALAPAVERLELALAEIARQHPGFHFHVTGTLPVVAGNLWAIIGDLQWSLGSCTVLVFAVIALSLRSLRLSLISLLPDTLPLLVASAFLVLSGEPLRVVSMLTFSLCFGISVDDSIHFLVRFQRTLRSQPLVAAIHETFQETGAGIVTGTVIIVGGFSIMLLSSMPSIRSFAMLCGLTMTAGLATMLLLLPALLLCFGPKPRRAEEQVAVQQVLLAHEATA